MQYQVMRVDEWLADPTQSSIHGSFERGCFGLRHYSASCDLVFKGLALFIVTVNVAQLDILEWDEGVFRK